MTVTFKKHEDAKLGRARYEWTVLDGAGKAVGLTSWSPASEEFEAFYAAVAEARRAMCPEAEVRVSVLG